MDQKRGNDKVLVKVYLQQIEDSIQSLGKGQATEATSDEKQFSSEQN